MIGDPHRAVFVAVPEGLVELLDDLATGQTVGEARDRYLTRHGERPDVASVLSQLRDRGLLWPADGAPPATELGGGPRQRGHFAGFPRPLARALFGPVALTAYTLVSVLALVLVAFDPAIVPTWRAFFFPEQFATLAPLLLILHLAATFVHEMAHLVAARAAGVATRLGIGNRLWILVAEADMTGIWALPPRRRYVPVLAGPVLDAVSASFLVFLLAAAHRGLLALSPFAVAVCEAMLLRYLLGIAWQFYFFVRTDFYYVLATFLRSKNLLADTEVFLANQVHRWLGWLRYRDQSRLPARERAAIRGYAVVWVLGRVAMVVVFVTVQLPLAFHYLSLVVATFQGGSETPPSFDVLLTAVVVVLSLTLGLGMWAREIVRKRQKGARS